MSATKEMSHNGIKYENKKESIFYKFSCLFLKFFLYLIPPYSKNK